MKNTLRCCISCILPCGALDVIRIVHSNGRVEELTGTILAAEVMKAHPKHVLKKPSTSSSSATSPGPAIVVVPPDAELRRGKIYFLIPVVGPTTKEKKKQPKTRDNKNNNHHHERKKKCESGSGCNKSTTAKANLVISSDQYLTEILNEKVSTQRERRRGRVAVWRPHLESICESLPDTL